MDEKLVTRFRRITDLKKEIIKDNPEHSLYQCLAKTKSIQGKGPYCRTKVDKPWKRCKHHDKMGKLRKRVGRPPTGGKYSSSLKGKSGELYEEYRSDPQIVDLTDEIALLRVCVSELKELADEHKGLKRNQAYREVLSEAVKTLESVSKVAQALVKIEATYFSVQSLQIALQQVVNIVRMSITNCPHCGKDLSPLVREIGSSLKQIHLKDVIETKALPLGDK